MAGPEFKQVSEGEPIPFFKRDGFKTARVIVGTLLIAYGMANLEIIRRARATYLKAEEDFGQKRYKEAMWSYQQVQEFYMLPRSKWVDMAAEKEFICRAYLGDWIPPEGPMDADVRTLRQDYPKYAAEVAQITPVGDSSYQPSPQTMQEKNPPKPGKKKK
jgi:hypothetical protein